MTDALQQMLNDLESHQLTVALAPLNPNGRGYNECGMKRVLLDQNPKWYRRLCRDHTSSRGVRRGKHDTLIRRQNVLRQLRGLIAGTYRGKYQEALLRIARSIA